MTELLPPGIRTDACWQQHRRQPTRAAVYASRQDPEGFFAIAVDGEPQVVTYEVEVEEEAGESSDL